jgi:peptidoglycan/LPS O-acetylase OafA/YrhL
VGGSNGGSDLRVRLGRGRPFLCAVRILDHRYFTGDQEFKSLLQELFARRFLRIFPLYYAFLAVLFLWKHQFYSGRGMASLLLYYYNLYAAAVGHHWPFVNSLWSLAVEEQFYLLWPLLVRSVSEKILARVCIGGMIVALVLRLIIVPHSTVFQSAYYLTPCRMDTLLLGSLLAIWHRDAAMWKLVQRYASRVILFASLAIAMIAGWSGHFMDAVMKEELGAFRHTSILVVGPGITCLAFLFGRLLVKCTHQEPVQRIFLNRALRSIGKYSYGMYMLHWLFLGVLQHRVVSKIALHLPHSSDAYLYLVLAVAATYASAYVSFNLMERHFLSLKRRFPAFEMSPPSTEKVETSARPGRSTFPLGLED